MADRPFRNPLLAKLDKTGHYSIRSAWEGLEYLLSYWRSDRNASYKIALHVCRDAVDGWVSPERAREALKRALEAAGLSISKPRRPPPKVHSSKFRNIHPVASEQLALIRSSIATHGRNEHSAFDRLDEARPCEPRIDLDYPRLRQPH